MAEEKGQRFGKYVPISSGGQVRFYLPLERCADVEQLGAGGYDVASESQGLLKTARLIREAAGRRAESEERKSRYVAECLADFSREAGSIDVLCPYCLGRVNANWPPNLGEALCGWYDRVTDMCDGNAAYTIDRAHLVLGIPEVERYSCPARGTTLDLAVYDLHYLKEEVARRTRAICASSVRGEAPACDVELARVLPLRVGLDRTRRGFKAFIVDLMEKDAIDWLNTLSLEELASLLDRSAPADITPVPRQEPNR